MNKIDEAVKKETRYITIWVLLLSVLTQTVFLVIGKWDYTVLLGNLLSGTVAILNFFFMGLSLQSALNKEEKDAKNTMKLSRTYRNLFIMIYTIVGVVLPCFNLWTVLLPLLYPRIAIVFRPCFDKKQS
jgi:carbon starvation protein CstA